MESGKIRAGTTQVIERKTGGTPERGHAFTPGPSLTRFFLSHPVPLLRIKDDIALLTSDIVLFSLFALSML